MQKHPIVRVRNRNRSRRCKSRSLIWINLTWPSPLDDVGGGAEIRRGGFLVIIHKKILEWQAAHPNVTWIGWGIVWAIVLVLLSWPSRTLR